MSPMCHPGIRCSIQAFKSDKVTIQESTFLHEDDTTT